MGGKDTLNFYRTCWYCAIFQPRWQLDCILAKFNQHLNMQAQSGTPQSRLMMPNLWSLFQPVEQVILKADWRTPKSNLLRQLDWPTLCWRREIASLVLFFEITCTRGPLWSVKHLFPFVSTKTPRQMRKLLQIPLARTSRFYPKPKVIFI